jgi:LemA protein
MNQEEAQTRGYTQDEWSEILRRAEQVRGEREDSLSDRTLVESAAEVGINEEDIREAQRRLEAEKQAEAEARTATSSLRKKALAAVLGVSLLTAGIGLTSYNGLNAQYQEQARTRADLQAALQRRADVVTRAESIVRQTGVDRAEMNRRLADARKGLNSKDLAEQLEADRRLDQVASEIAAKNGSSELTLDLVAQVEGSENRVNVARQRLNAAVANYNARARSFPTSLFRPFFGLPAGVPSFEATVTVPGAG